MTMATPDAARARGLPRSWRSASGAGRSAAAARPCCNPFGGGGARRAGAPLRRRSNPAPDSRGVITYATYQVAVARDGDTLATIADRLGTTPARARRPQRAAGRLPPARRRGAAAARQRAAPGGGGARQPATSRSQPLGWTPDQRLRGHRQRRRRRRRPRNPFQNGQTEPLIDPVRHRVEAGETAYSIARLYGVSVTALASWNGLGPDLAVRENQELLIPIVSGANQISSRADTQPGQGDAGRRRRRARPPRCPQTSPRRSTPPRRRTSASTARRRAAG